MSYPPVAGNQTARFMGGELFGVGLEGKGDRRHESSETDVAQPTATFRFDGQCHVSEPSGVVGGNLPANAGQQRRDRESQRAEHFSQEGVLFETVASSMLPDELVGDGVGLDVDPSTEQDVEIFKGNCLHVVLVNRPEHGRGRFARPVLADAAKVGVKSEEVGGHGGGDKAHSTGTRRTILPGRLRTR